MIKGVKTPKFKVVGNQGKIFISTFEGTNRRRMIPGVQIWSQNFFLSTCWIFRIFDFGGWLASHLQIDARDPQKGEKKKKLIRFEKLNRPIIPIFGGCLKGP